MKKFIPIFSIAIASVCLQNCINREEDIVSDSDPLTEIEKEMMMRGDSAKSSGEILDPDPDPPVRDGDNWRSIPNK
ncbi:hypothetical protein GSF70_10215 [Flavobacteriaceae bacterium W22]|nr:hypothetical protein [Flavobacteriaceae bacterium W22]